MQCPHCNANISNDATFCPVCGKAVTRPVQQVQKQVKYVEETQVIPSKYQPISPWGYFGLQLLFTIPVVGFVFLIVFSVSSANLNRRNFARSYFCVYALALIAAIICVIAFGGAIEGLSQYLSQM